MGLVQRHPNFAGYPDPKAQSIYLVAAPNPMGSQARYTQDTSSDGELNPMSLYLNSDNLGMNSQILSQPRILPMEGSNQGTISPHSTTDKSVGSERGLLYHDHARRIATAPYGTQPDCYGGRLPTTSTQVPVQAASSSSIAHTESPRMITSFYTQRIDNSQNQNLLGSSLGTYSSKLHNRSNIYVLYLFSSEFGLEIFELKH